jgi:CrcB protein
MKTIMLVGIGGFAGSVFRYLLQVFVGRHVMHTFPLGTLIVNGSGCLAIGLLYGMADRYAWLNPEWRIFLITGICGGFTTFSGFSFEGMSLLREGSYFYFALYVCLSVIGGLLLTIGGFALMK